MARCRNKETHVILESGESETQKTHHRVTKCMTIMEVQNTNVTKCMTSMEIQNTNADNENIQHKQTHFAEKATTNACEMCEHFSLDQCSYHSALKFKLNYN